MNKVNDLIKRIEKIEDWIRQNFEVKRTPIEENAFDRIVRVVCEEYGIKRELLYKRTHQSVAITPRFICYYFLRQAGFRDKDIGELFDHLNPYDHTSIVNGVKKVNNWKETDKHFKWRFERIEERL